MRPPVVVFAVGNPGRGDDALGPLLADRLAREGLPDVEVIADFQLQVEHALDLEGRRFAVFVDAALDCDGPFEVRAVVPRRDASHTTHALSPAAVLETYVRVTGLEPPPAWCLAVRGERFELGEGLTAQAQRNFEAAWTRLLQLGTSRQGSGAPTGTATSRPACLTPTYRGRRRLSPTKTAMPHQISTNPAARGPAKGSR